jgi:hypothetical protein
VAQLIAGASARLRGVEVDLQPLRPAKGTVDKPLPTPLQLRLRTVQADLSQSASALASTVEKWKPPTVAIKQLTEAKAALDVIAAGKLDSKGADIEAVHKKLAASLEELVRWSRAGFQ